MTQYITIISLILVLIQMVTMHHQTCPPARYINFNLEEFSGIWYQYVYDTTDGVDFFSCEILNVTSTAEDDDSYFAEISVPPNITNRYFLTEIQGPSFHYTLIRDPTFQIIETVVKLTDDKTKVAISNILFQNRYSTTFVVLSSRLGYLDTSLHDRLLASTGFHITSNTTIIPTSRCPTMVSTLPNF